MTLEADTNKVTKRLQENIDTPLYCAGFYLIQAISDRMSRGYKIVKVEIFAEGDTRETTVYSITHTL